MKYFFSGGSFIKTSSITSKMNAKLKSATLSRLQAMFKQSNEAHIVNKNTRTTFLCASRHFLMYCEKMNCEVVADISGLFDDWEKSLTRGLRTYKNHVRNHFLPFVKTLIKHGYAPVDIHFEKKLKYFFRKNKLHKANK